MVITSLHLSCRKDRAEGQHRVPVISSISKLIQAFDGADMRKTCWVSHFCNFRGLSVRPTFLMTEMRPRSGKHPTALPDYKLYLSASPGPVGQAGGRVLVFQEYILNVTLLRQAGSKLDMLGLLNIFAGYMLKNIDALMPVADVRCIWMGFLQIKCAFSLGNVQISCYFARKQALEILSARSVSNKRLKSLFSSYEQVIIVLWMIFCQFCFYKDVYPHLTHLHVTVLTSTPWKQ